MDEREFDKFADEYRDLHARNISASGEGPEFFAEYKVRDTKRIADQEGIVPSRILDFGCGVGGSIPYFQQYFPTSSVVGADVSSKSLGIAGKRFGSRFEGSLIDSDQLALPSQSIDVLFSACVFHHIPHAEHEAWLAELRRVARPGALLVIFEHNPWNPLTVRAVNTCEFDENAVLMTSSALRRRLGRAGWNVLRHEYRIFFPHALRAMRNLEAYLRWLPFGAQYSVIAKA